LENLANKYRLGEQTLERSRAEFEAIFNAIADAAVFCDTERNVLMVNPAFTSLFGYKPEEVKGKTTEMLYADKSEYHMQGEKRFHLRSQEETSDEPSLYEISYLKKDGTVFPSETVGMRVKDSTGRIIGFLGIARDITERKKTETALLESEERFRLTFEQVAVGMAHVGLKGEWLRVNGKFCDIVGYTYDELRKLTFQDITHPEDLDTALENINKLLHDEIKNFIMDKRLVKKDGTIVWADVTSSLVRDHRGAPQYFISVVEDISERKKIEAAIMKEREWAQKYLDIAGVMLLVIGADQKVRLINKKGCEILGCMEREIVGKDWFENYLPESSREKLRIIFQKIMAGAVRTLEKYENPVVCKGGFERMIEWNNAILKDKGGNILGVLSSGEDITERKKMEEALKHRAYHDTLTDLPNRALFMDFLNLELAEARRNNRKAAVLFLDLDNFKKINDELGHSAGDELLKEAAARLKTCVRETDTVARIGGDEFNLLLTDAVSADKAVVIVRKIISLFQSPFRIHGSEFIITASIGISVYPDDSDNSETLLKYADIAMYHAKKQGRNNYQFYDPAMNIRTLERMRVERDLNRAIRLGELKLYYLPQISIDTGRPVCAEALVRWHCPKFGLLSPMQFVPIAEETGLILPMGEWVLKTACAQNKAWQVEGFPSLCVTVNMSSRQFREPDLAEKVSRILNETGLNAEFLEIDINEATAMSDSETIISNMSRLNETGVKISVDDFGTGYSSPACLKKLHIKKLKIDKVFIDNMLVDPDYRDIVDAAIGMAHRLKIEVIAEGVESEAQMEFLKSLKCDGVQGFLFGKPRPAEELKELRA